MKQTTKRAAALLILTIIISIKGYAQIPIAQVSESARDTVIYENSQQPAQIKKRHTATGYFCEGIGVSIPVGNYASTSSANPYTTSAMYYNTTTNAGFAKAGEHFFIEFAKPVAMSNVGFVIKTDIYINRINVLAMEREYGWNLSTATYHTATLMGGLFVTIPTDKISYDFKILLGFSSDNYTSEGMGYSANPSFTFGGGFNIRYVFTKHFCGLLNTGVIHTQQNYLLSNLPNSSNHQSVIPTTLVNISLGAGYQFRSHEKHKKYANG